MGVNELEEERKRRLDAGAVNPFNPEEFTKLLKKTSPINPVLTPDDYKRLCDTVKHLAFLKMQASKQVQVLSKERDDFARIIMATAKASGGVLYVKNNYLKSLADDAQLKVDPMPDGVRFTLDEPKKLLLPPGALGG